MPELPEVSYFKKYVDSTALHKKIAKIEFPEKKILQDSPQAISRALKDAEFKSTRRIGKYLVFETDQDKVLVFHFGMTGKFEYSHEAEPPDHSRLIIHFKDNSKLFFVCPRKFGKVYLANGFEDFKKEHKLGTDAMDLKKKEFMELLDGKKGSIKSALMDQHIIAGIGNLYSDEVLFQSKIHPKSSIAKLSEEEKGEIYKNIGKVLERVTKTRMEGSKLPDSYLTRHREEGEDCPSCDGKIKLTKVSGRSTYYCSGCQKEK
ncbi:formamidopyrimidine-DNA glycosylase [Christiangramia fulva]|uniref:Formamidopyrimidine-DNA glycosylase n=1 Tax=Christiangramia fulva TaxID=2126553 RepID=A0A2R3Z4F9_9FLAO|nr:DNA-formamidopyrimidine glycosylase family protein [Christiangramia fulva]AVR45149.1 formamidopyrimidine-DNA glycosylase [Christiangramia fulva]